MFLVELMSFVTNVSRKHVVEIISQSLWLVKISFEILTLEPGRVYVWGKMHKKQDSASVPEQFGMAIRMPGMRAQALIEESIQQYYSGVLTEEETELQNFGIFAPFLQVSQ